MENNRKPRIAIIGLKGLPAFGGAASVGESLITALNDSFHFTVLSVSSHSNVNDRFVNGIQQIVFINHGKGALNTFLYYLKSLWYVFFHYDYDIIHLHHAESGFITPFLRIRYKVVVTFHGIYKQNDPKFSKIHNWFFRFSERLNVIWANEIISVSKPDSLYIEKRYGRKIHYIPNGISINNKLFEKVIKKQQKDYILFAAGRIYEIKGLHILLDAMETMDTNVKVLIAGDINQVPEYSAMIKEKSKDLKTEFLGLIKDKNKLMKLVADAKLFVFPSLTEAMSMMLLEVVSMKTPVIASDIPSNKAIFTNKEVLFFKNNESEDLKEKLTFALSNIDQMNSMAKKAYEKLKIEYTWEKIADEYSYIFNKVVQ